MGDRFQFDQTAGHNLKLLHVVDAFTREALAIECHRRPDADKTVATLDRLLAERGTAPGFIRCDNGPEMTANALRDWCRFSRAGSAHIKPGAPGQNRFVESFGGRVRDELLSVELFSCLAEARVLIEDWRIDYSEHRPAQLARMLTPTGSLWATGRPTWPGRAREHRPPQSLRARSVRRRRQPYPAVSNHSRWVRLRLTSQPSSSSN